LSLAPSVWLGKLSEAKFSLVPIWLPFYTFKWKEKAPSLQRCLGFRLLVYKSTTQLHSMQFASKIKNLNVTTNLKDLERDLDPSHKDLAHCSIRCL